jgi:multidrug efflux pump subunit AcrA (membrane-fusion protein)
MRVSDVHVRLPKWTDLLHTDSKLHSLHRVGGFRAARVLALILMLVIATLAACLILVPWVQTVSGKGSVVVYSPSERQQDLQAPVDGRIERWHVHEGDKVSAGDPIVDIADIDPNIMDRLEIERRAAETKLEAAQKSVGTSKINLDRQKMLWSQGLSSRRSFELAELEYAKFLGEVSSASAELARIETKLARQASQSVTASRAGVVQRIVAPEGGVLVKQGDRLAVIVPESSDRAVELFVSGNDIPLLTVGREVRLQFEGWPAVQFAGWPSVAVGTFAGRVGVVDATGDEQGRFRIVVFPTDPTSWPDARYLRQGVRVVGWILLDEVRLGWELWRRFNAFPLNAPKDHPKAEKKEL